MVMQFCNSLWPRELRHGAKDVGHTFVGKCLALFGSLGQREVAHSLHALERPREVWATWRVLLPF